jgi:predicted alpha/beta superfamily hydrolase
MISSLSHVDQKFKIFVAFPDSYADSTKIYPVVYVLDANWYFGTVTEIVRMLALLQELPELVVVGIGYPVNSIMEAVAVRIRDYTPTVDDGWYQREIVKAFPNAPEYVGSGGAPGFLQFIQEELMPFIHVNYRTDPGDQTIVGHSAGSLFALYTLFHHPDTFNRYVVASPSIWWGEAVTLRYESDFAANNSDLSARVFISVGELEESDTMVTNTMNMAKILEGRSYMSLRITTHIFEEETHISVVPASVSRGLRVVFE